MTRNLFLALGLAALAACAATHELAVAPEPATEPNLRVAGNRIFLPAIINGVATEALLDSGAELSLVDTAFGEEIGLVPSGSAEARGTGPGTQQVQFANGVILEAAGQALEDKVVAVMDLSDISARIAGHPLTVILGRELFDAGAWRLDVEAGVFTRHSTDALPRHGALALSDAHGIKQVDVLINGVPVKADFDFGNGSEVLLSQTFAERAGLLAPGNIVGTKMGGGVGGEIERTLVRVDALEIGGHLIEDITAAVSPQSDGAEANIGVSVLRRFQMTIDFPGNRVWLEPHQ